MHTLDGMFIAGHTHVHNLIHTQNQFSIDNAYYLHLGGMVLGGGRKPTSAEGEHALKFQNILLDLF